MKDIGFDTIGKYAQQLNEMGLEQALAKGREKLEQAEEHKQKPLEKRNFEELAALVVGAMESGAAAFWNDMTTFLVRQAILEQDTEVLAEILEKLGEAKLLGDAWPPREYSEAELQQLRSAAKGTIEAISAKLKVLDKMLPEAAKLPTVDDLAEKTKSLISSVHDKYKALPVEQLRARISEPIIALAKEDGVDLDAGKPDEIQAYLNDKLGDLLETYKLMREFVSSFPEHKETYADLLVRMMRLNNADPEEVVKTAAEWQGNQDRLPAVAMVGKVIKEKLLAFQTIKQALVMAIDAALQPGDPIENVVQAFRQEENLVLLDRLLREEGGMEKIGEMVMTLKKLGVPIKLPNLLEG